MTFADKLAKKAFHSAVIQNSWQTHMRVFGPILEPAFAGQYRVRIELTGALNHINRGELKKALVKLEALKPNCISPPDYAAWYYFVGLCMELAGRKEEMLYYYQEAGDYGHTYFLPYLKIAKAAHSDAAFASAEMNYKQGVHCLTLNPPDEQNRSILGSAYTNYASCLTMMHRYEEAEELLRKADDILPEQKGRAAAEAILAAAEGDGERARNAVEKLAADASSSYETTKVMVERILNKEHPHFTSIEVNPKEVEAFWVWFKKEEAVLQKKLKQEDYQAVLQMLQQKMKEVFPFMERDPEIGIEPEGSLYKITLADLFVRSLTSGYQELINAMPQSLAAHWRFEVAH